MIESLLSGMRHEVGGLLQSIYSCAAILRHRLPADWHLERAAVEDLRCRAESCKLLLNKVHDVLRPFTPAWDHVDLAKLASKLVSEAAARYPHHQVHTESSGDCSIWADYMRMAQIGRLLLDWAFDTARQEVHSRTAFRPETGQVEWEISNDDPNWSMEQTDQLLHELFIRRQSGLGLGLAPLRKLVHLHGGTIQAESQPAGGLRIRVALPHDPHSVSVEMCAPVDNRLACDPVA